MTGKDYFNLIGVFVWSIFNLFWLIVAYGNKNLQSIIASSLFLGFQLAVLFFMIYGIIKHGMLPIF